MDQSLLPNRRRHAEDARRSVVDLIDQKIQSGAWAPGDRIPTERELEVEFRVARNTLRKGLKKLEAEGKITREVGRGAFVAAQGAAVASPPQAARTLQDLMGSSPAEVMEVRLMLEPRAAELAAARASLAEIRIMEDCLEGAIKAADVPEFEHWDGLLHKTIIDSARNDFLTGIYETINSIRNQPEWTKLKARTVTDARRARYQDQHGAIVGALRDRDSQRAREAMQSHLLEVKSNLLGE